MDDVLSPIFDYKKSIFRDRISNYGTGITLSYATGAFGMALIAVAMVKCCNFDVRRSAMILMVNLRHWADQGSVGGSDVPRGYMEFDREEIQGSYALRNHEKTVRLLVLGVIISALSLPLLLYLKHLKGECNTQLDNLNEWG